MKLGSSLGAAAALATIVAAGVALYGFLFPEISAVRVEQPQQSPTIVGNQNTKVSINYGGRFDKLIDAEKREKSLVAFDAQGNQWRKKFDTDIQQVAVCDLDSDGNKEVLVGFSSLGPRHSTLMAFDSRGNELWSFRKKPDYPYIGGQSGKFYVADIKVFTIGGQKAISAFFNDGTWYPSAWVILSAAGKKLKQLWHPGGLGQAEYYRGMLVVKGLNNDLRSAFPNNAKNVPVVFAVRYENIHGQAPPYMGSVANNRDFQWYYALSHPKVSMGKLEQVKGRIRFWTSCGRAFYLDERGDTKAVGKGDGMVCPQNFRLVPLYLGPGKVN